MMKELASENSIFLGRIILVFSLISLRVGLLLRLSFFITFLTFQWPDFFHKFLLFLVSQVAEELSLVVEIEVFDVSHC